MEQTKAPHISCDNTVSGTMLSVALATVPALLWGFYVFGRRVISLALLSVACSVLFEIISCRIMKRQNPTGDFSAVVTGLILTLNLPVSAPLWFAPLGAAFAIIIVKQLFGGLGKNFLNPVLCARAFLYISFPNEMTRMTRPFATFPLLSLSAGDDLIAEATEGLESEIPTRVDIIFGKCPGFIGEVSAVLIILGALFLFFTKTASFYVPVSFVGTVAVLSIIFPDGEAVSSVFNAVFTGGLLLGAVFSATDPVTSPITYKGKVIFGIGCGVLTVFFRKFGVAHEAVTFAILTMEVFTWYIDKFTRPTPFGRKRGLV